MRAGRGRAQLAESLHPPAQLPALEAVARDPREHGRLHHGQRGRDTLLPHPVHGGFDGSLLAYERRGRDEKLDEVGATLLARAGRAGDVEVREDGAAVCEEHCGGAQATVRDARVRERTRL